MRQTGRHDVRGACDAAGHRRHRPGRSRACRPGAQPGAAPSGQPRLAAPAGGRSRRAGGRRGAARRAAAPGSREAVRGPRLPPDPGAGQPARLAVRVRRRAGCVPGRRGGAGAAGAGPSGVDPHAARRADSGVLAFGLPRRLPDGGRHRPGSGSEPAARAGACLVRGAQRGPDAPDDRPARRASRRPSGRLGGARPAYRCPGAGRPGGRSSSRWRPRPCGPAPRMSGCSASSRCTPTAPRGRWRAPAAWTSTCAGTSRTSGMPSCSPRAGRAGW